MISDDIRNDLVLAVSMLEGAGIIDFNGHCSIRLGDNALAINSGASVRSALKSEDIVAIYFDGKLIEGEDVPPMEFHIHAVLYRRSADVNAVVHAHPPYSTLLTMTGRTIEPVFPQGALLGPMPVFTDPLSINTKARGAAVADMIGDGRAGRLPTRGAALLGADLRGACATTGSLAAMPRTFNHCPVKFSMNASERESAIMRWTCCWSTSGSWRRPRVASWTNSSSGMLLQRKNERREASSRSLIR